MILVTGTIRLDPASVERAKEVIAPLVAATRQEPGNRDYGFWASIEEPGLFLVHEVWDDEAAMEAHMASEHMAAFIGVAGELGISETHISRHDVSGSSRLM